MQGEALSSIAAVSTLQITSKSCDLQTHSLLIKGGNVLHCGPASISRKPGTTVYIRDLFYNMPSRRLQVSTKESCDSIKRFLEPVLLISKHVRFSIIDVDTGRKILSTKQSESYLGMFKQIHGQMIAKDADNVEWKCPLAELEGFLSCNRFASKMHQYIYVNRHFLSPLENPLYKAVNDLFSKSKFSQQESASRTGLISPLKNFASNSAHPIFLLNISCDASIYDLTLDSEKNMIDFENWDEIISLVTNCTQNYLLRNNLLNQDPHVSFHMEADGNVDSGDSTRFQNTQSPMRLDRTTTPKLNSIYHPPDEFFSFLRNVKTGSAGQSSVRKRTASDWDEGVFSDYGYDERLATHNRGSSSTSRKKSNVSSTIEKFTNVPQYPGKSSRTAVIERLQQTRVNGLGISKVQPAKIQSVSKLSETGEPRTWAASLLNEWKNPVFRAPDLPPKSNDPNQTQTQMIVNSFNPGVSAIPVAYPISKQNISTLRVINQVDTKFIAAWFPMFKDDASSSNHSSGVVDCGLVIIDQHAADERVKLEGILRQTFAEVDQDAPSAADPVETHTAYKPKTKISDSVRLETPLKISMSQRELVGIFRYREIFAQWGIEIMDVSEENGTSGNEDSEVKQAEGGAPKQTAYVGGESFARPQHYEPTAELFVIKIPRAIVARCIADPSLVAGILLEHLLRIEEMNSSGYHKTNSFISATVTSAALGCPRGIMNLLNSKACRSAIMFGDELQPSDCEKIVQDLKECKFPFQCAHGRPSMTLLSVLKKGKRHGPSKRFAPNLYAKFTK
ncbi:DNA mismatch repair protein [Chytriomyces hyalinus]|nr:DNA mismatch repair protein [Chytriomyces hyalinus]